MSPRHPFWAEKVVDRPREAARVSVACPSLLVMMLVVCCWWSTMNSACDQRPLSTLRHRVVGLNGERATAFYDGPDRRLVSRSAICRVEFRRLRSAHLVAFGVEGRVIGIPFPGISVILPGAPSNLLNVSTIYLPIVVTATVRVTSSAPVPTTSDVTFAFHSSLLQALTALGLAVGAGKRSATSRFQALHTGHVNRWTYVFEIWNSNAVGQRVPSLQFYFRDMPAGYPRGADYGWPLMEPDVIRGLSRGELQVVTASRTGISLEEANVTVRVGHPTKLVVSDAAPTHPYSGADAVCRSLGYQRVAYVTTVEQQLAVNRLLLETPLGGLWMGATKVSPSTIFCWSTSPMYTVAAACTGAGLGVMDASDDACLRPAPDNCSGIVVSPVVAPDEALRYTKSGGAWLLSNVDISDPTKKYRSVCMSGLPDSTFTGQYDISPRFGITRTKEKPGKMWTASRSLKPSRTYTKIETRSGGTATETALGERTSSRRKSLSDTLTLDSSMTTFPSWSTSIEASPSESARAAPDSTNATTAVPSPTSGGNVTTTTTIRPVDTTTTTTPPGPSGTNGTSSIGENPTDVALSKTASAVVMPIASATAVAGGFASPSAGGSVIALQNILLLVDCRSGKPEPTSGAVADLIPQSIRIGNTTFAAHIGNASMLLGAYTAAILFTLLFFFACDQLSKGALVTKGVAYLCRMLYSFGLPTAIATLTTVIAFSASDSIDFKFGLSEFFVGWFLFPVPHVLHLAIPGTAGSFAVFIGELRKGVAHRPIARLWLLESGLKACFIAMVIRSRYVIGCTVSASLVILIAVLHLAYVAVIRPDMSIIVRSTSIAVAVLLLVQAILALVSLYDARFTPFVGVAATFQVGLLALSTVINLFLKTIAGVRNALNPPIVKKAVRWRDEELGLPLRPPDPGSFAAFVGSDARRQHLGLLLLASRAAFQRQQGDEAARRYDVQDLYRKAVADVNATANRNQQLELYAQQLAKQGASPDVLAELLPAPERPHPRVLSITLGHGASSLLHGDAEVPGVANRFSPAWFAAQHDVDQRYAAVTGRQVSTSRLQQVPSIRGVNSALDGDDDESSDDGYL